MEFYSASRTANERPKRILLVDDVELNRVLTEAILRKAHYEVESVADGLAALAALERKDFDLVLLDIEMPGLDGHETALKIKTIENGAVRLAALTASTADDKRERSEVIGLHAHIERPIKPQALLDAVAAILLQPSRIQGHEPWERPLYKELVGRLGAKRMHGFLLGLASEFEVLTSMLTQVSNADQLHRKAHDLASVAGMLGFTEVTRRCRHLMSRLGTDEETFEREALGAAITRARARLVTYLSADVERACA